jgi:hypothetical protein
MNLKSFVAGQRRGVNLILSLYTALLVLMWVATVCDWAFNLGWGWDRKIIWLAPPMLLFGVFVRFCCVAVFNFFGGNTHGS